MGDFNKVMVLGRLTREPEVRYTPSGTPVCDLGLATNRRIPAGEGQWKDETTYIDVTLWRRQAEVAGQYLAKGREVFIEGYLSMDSWEDKNTGQKRTKLKVVCDNMQLIGGGGNQGGGRPQNQSEGGYSQPQSSGYQQTPSAPAPQPSNNAAPAQPAFEPEEEDDIPF